MPRMAFAPYLDLSLVPSASIKALSMAAWLITSMPFTTSASTLFTLSTAFLHALAEVTGFIAVAQFQRFSFACGCAAGHHGAAKVTAGSGNLYFDGGVALGLKFLLHVHQRSVTYEKVLLI